MKPLAGEIWLTLRQTYRQHPKPLQKFSHITLAVLAGMTMLMLWGAVLGALGGYGMSLALQHPLFDQRAWFESRTNLVSQAAETGALGGILLGLLVFNLALWRNPGLLHPQPFLTLCRHFAKCSLIGIALGVVNLIPMGALLACYLADNNIDLGTYFWFQSAWFLPSSMLAAEGALNGYLWGIALGFIGGTIYALINACKFNPLKKTGTPGHS